MIHREKSELLESGLLGISKEFKVSWNGDSVTLYISSPKSTLSIWFDTESNEVSIGLGDIFNQKMIWHLHVFMDGAKSGQDEIIYACNFLKMVLEGKIRFNLKTNVEAEVVNKLESSNKNKLWNEL